MPEGLQFQANLQVVIRTGHKISQYQLEAAIKPQPAAYCPLQFGAKVTLCSSGGKNKQKQNKQTPESSYHSCWCNIFLFEMKRSPTLYLNPQTSCSLMQLYNTFICSQHFKVFSKTVYSGWKNRAVFSTICISQCHLEGGNNVWRWSSCFVTGIRNE